MEHISMDNIKVSELKDVIKTIVRESIAERSQVQEVSPPGKKAERMIHHVKTSLRKSHPDWDEDKIKSVAIATGWKAHNKGSVEEACDCGKEDCDCKKGKGDQIPKGKLAHLNPKIADKGEKGKMKLPPKVKEAGLTSEDETDHPSSQTVAKYGPEGNTAVDWMMQAPTVLRQMFAQAREKGDREKMQAVRDILKGITDFRKGRSEMPFEEDSKEKTNEASYKQVSPNETDTAAEDKARTIQTDPKVNEASYKVVAPRMATDAKEDKAREIQTEPKVNETAYKTQGPSLKTFDDSPQFPKAVNDPENA